VRLDEIHGRYGDHVTFYVVYIREAHATNGWQVESNVAESVLFTQPETYDERVEVAQACTLGLDIKIPTLIDDMDDKVNAAYAALPDRLYLIDAEGRVAFKSGPGPAGFKPDDFEAAIKECVGEQ
jgi:hypothetical protein